MGRVHLFELGDQPWFPEVLHRVYSPDEMHALVRSLGPNDYVWDIGRLPVAIAYPGSRT